MKSTTRSTHKNNIKDIDDFVKVFSKCKNIITICGAGISVSCGIPDFRSATGLYNTLDCDKIGIPSAELLFDLEFFKIDPHPFYKFAPILLPKIKPVPSISHEFINNINKSKKLLINYTQNIDGIERSMGMDMNHVIECHGSMQTFKCCKCNKKYDFKKIEKYLHNQDIPYCNNKTCSNKNKKNGKKKKKKNCDDDDDTEQHNGGGILKPEVTFFGEELPDLFMDSLDEDVLRECDMVIVLGTSLKVGGSVHEVLSMIGRLGMQHGVKVPFVLINREPVKLPASVPGGFDIMFLGDCDVVCSHLQQLCFDNDNNDDDTTTSNYQLLKKSKLNHQDTDTVDVVSTFSNADNSSLLSQSALSVVICDNISSDINHNSKSIEKSYELFEDNECKSKNLMKLSVVRIDSDVNEENEKMNNNYERLTEVTHTVDKSPTLSKPNCPVYQLTEIK